MQSYALNFHFGLMVLPKEGLVESKEPLE